VDRSNPDVSALYRPLHPAILRMIRSVVEAGAACRRPVAVCGEMAADPLGIGVLVGLQIRELSVTPVAISGVKDTLLAIDSNRARMLAVKALNASEASEVEKMFRALPHAAAAVTTEKRALRIHESEPLQ
jgi:multiphosphoryl transfer protein